MEILKTISIAGIVSFLITLFNKEHDKYIKSKDDYFNLFLTIFYGKYKESKDFNVKKFYSENCISILLDHFRALVTAILRQHFHQ